MKLKLLAIAIVLFGFSAGRSQNAQKSYQELNTESERLAFIIKLIESRKLAVAENFKVARCTFGSELHEIKKNGRIFYRVYLNEDEEKGWFLHLERSNNDRIWLYFLSTLTRDEDLYLK